MSHTVLLCYCELSGLPQSCQGAGAAQALIQNPKVEFLITTSEEGARSFAASMGNKL